MPEGDTIHRAAARIRPVLAGHVPDELATPHPRFERDRWPARLAGRAVTAVDAYGKHLLLRFEGGLVIHSHLRMTGRWRVAAPAPRSRAVWLALRRGEREAIQLRGPVLELLTDARVRSLLGRLGPDILAPEFDCARFLSRLRDDDPTRPIGDALLDQRTLAGIGNKWKVESFFAARIDPWRAAGAVSDDEVLAVIAACRPAMQRSAAGHEPPPAIYRRAGRPCPHCAATIRSRGQGDDARMTYWCPRCQQ